MDNYLTDVTKIQQIRDEAFVDDPRPLFLSAFAPRVTPITPKTFHYLRAVECPLLMGISNRSAIRVFCWLHWAHWKGTRLNFRLWRLLHPWINYERCFKAILEAITDAHLDMPRIGRAADEKDQETESYPSPVYIVAFFAKQTGWSEREIMNMPLERLYMYFQVIKPETNDVKFGPSDNLTAAYLQKANEAGPQTVKRV